ncbi:thioesterase family protein [Aureisphaera sp. CAU 1614]|uniref:Thioesterase family protein n=1 Tax=Halomarinibacterium sedimenti TaxID=2857106 RepID=A0A9X1FQA0_9FLAO|nr:thioesterase family protein [Halomarinibacterium sedimenti]MBW2938453.1 thioesterase family protein [Halomarinibacterium sedimenti]
MYTKQFEIRWSDVDANLHLRNSAYIDYMSHTRMSYFNEKGFGQKRLYKMHLGPVALYEHMYYFKEVFPGKPIQVSIQLNGISEKGTFFSFVHNFYNREGKNLARCEMLGAWIDLETRKLADPPQDIWNFLDGIDKTEDFKILTKEDTRKFQQHPKDL